MFNFRLYFSSVFPKWIYYEKKQSSTKLRQMNFKVRKIMEDIKYSELFFLNLQIIIHTSVPKIFKY